MAECWVCGNTEEDGVRFGNASEGKGAGGSEVKINLGCLGCTFEILGLILLIFVLWHLREIWRWLERLLQ